MDREFPIKGRYVVVIWLIPFFYLPGLSYIYRLIEFGAEPYWFDIAYFYYSETLFAALLFSLFALHKIDPRLMLSPVSKQEYLPAIKLTAFIYIFSIATAFALFYPLSFVLPEFVKYWFIELPSIIYWSQGSYPIVPNILSFISLVVLAPVLEEFAFRGVLLHRWTAKWGMNPAILTSSILFGVVHSDPIGAFAFGVAMCVLYLRTQSLIVPIVCHALNNLVAWLFEAGSKVVKGPDYTYTLEDFHSEWWMGVACGIICIAWAWVYINGKRSNRVWALPKI